MAHEFNNQASKAERHEVLRNDTMFSRQQNTVDDAGGRYAKITPSTLTGQSYQVPQLPENSPWASGFDKNLEPVLGFSVDAMPHEEPTPSVASSAGVGSLVADVASFPAPSATGSASIKRRVW